MITSLDNARIKEARKLQRRRQRHKSNALLLEGVRLVRDAFHSGAQVREVYYVPELVADHAEAQQLLAELKAAAIDVLDCTTAVLASLTETVTPQGIVAVVALPTLPLPAKVDFVLILDQVRDPGNAGTLLRAAEAAGVTVAIFGPETVDPFNDKVLRAGMGAHFRLPLRICPEWPAIQAILPPEVTCYLAQADAPLAYDAIDWCAPIALVVGGEADGASPTAYHIAQPIAIPMHGQVESLNAAMAGTVILFEAARQRRQTSSVA